MHVKRFVLYNRVYNSAYFDRITKWQFSIKLEASKLCKYKLCATNKVEEEHNNFPGINSIPNMCTYY